ncbi:MAG: 2-oxo acid dehydrogenase subunit E2 [Gemmatimonadetes bacterium]|jgi:pyruvate dehydrogenase E2 component (dihydrolipoamide acetyltransferase)|nr:2-oxo acid dehydrogenase subunit E2 [Gemmatimonadota bacterium]
MATKVVMEALSPTMEEGRLVKWVAAEGSAVKPGDVLAEVETDKAVMELVARAEGVLRTQLLAEGATAAVGTLLGVIAGADEDIAALIGGAAAAKPAATAPAPAAPSAAATPAAAPPAAILPTAALPTALPTALPAAAVPAAATPAGKVRSSPLARRLAADKGVDLAAIAGTGPNGRVIRRDIEAAPAGGTAAAAPRAPAAVAPPAGPDVVDVPLTQMRKTIARRLSESIGPIPTFYLTAELDLTRVQQLRASMAALGPEHKVSVNDVLLKAVALALVEHPEVNAHWLGDRIRRFARVHLGMAVATDDGLIVPVLADAHARRMTDLSRDAKRLAGLARERKLTPEQYSGATFSVSNLGMFGIDQFTAIINPPEVAILAVGAVETKPVHEAGAWVPRDVMRVTLSCDHRAIDGAVGARFLQTVRRYVENPLLLA